LIFFKFCLNFSNFLLLIASYFFFTINPTLANSLINSSIPHLKIELNLELPNKLDYLLHISNLHKNQNYSFTLNRGLSIQNLSSGDLIPPLVNSSIKYNYINKNHTEALFKISGELLNDDAVGTSVLILNSGSRWIPNFTSLQTYELKVKTEKNLIVFNPSLNLNDCGENCYHFKELRPQEDVHLLVGNFVEYSKTLNNKKKIGVLLLSKDDELAQQYLDLLPEFLTRNEKFFGEYPYSSFYVVENFKETGLGMPGFTLLGASVIRLPFILHSSLPHEVLHNWWGNGVYVDPNRGNWCEGLTTYGSDYVEQKLLGLEVNYRRDILVSYQDFVNSKTEFPINKFKEKNNETDQAIGYGKSLMLFHMLKNWVGDHKFNKALRNLFYTYKFKQIGFEEITNIFLKSTKSNINQFMQHWVNDTGSVEINVESTCKDGNRIVKIKSIPPKFQFILPYYLIENTETHHYSKKITNGYSKIELPPNFDGYINLDPEFDVFRKLSKGEKPLTLSRLLSSEKIYLLTSETLHSEAQLWIQGINQVFKGQIEWIRKPEDAPTGATIVIYGLKDRTNADLVLKHLPLDKISINNNSFFVTKKEIPMDGRAWLIMSYDQNRDQTLAWAIRAETVQPEAWGKQLSHYSKYGILFFNGKLNEFKTSWAEGESKLKIKLEPCPI
jgi:hypothetical protein